MDSGKVEARAYENTEYEYEGEGGGGNGRRTIIRDEPLR